MSYVPDKMLGLGGQVAGYSTYPKYLQELDRLDAGLTSRLIIACTSASRSRAEYEQLVEIEAQKHLSTMTYQYQYQYQYTPTSPFFPIGYATGAMPDSHTIDLNLLEKLKAVEPRKVSETMPERVDPITAWRAWKVFNDNEHGGGWKLKAVGSTGTWEPRQAMTAVCNKGKDKHPAPGYGCECGIWSFTALEELTPALSTYYEIKVIGKVAIWGRVIECEKGFRSSHAYPLELWLLDNSLEQLGHIYGVPVRTIETETEKTDGV